MRIVASLLSGCCLVVTCLGADPIPFEGTVSASLGRGGSPPTQLRFTREGNQVRIENPDLSKIEPINLVDLAAGKLTLIFPHNSSYMRIDLHAPPAPAGMPAPPTLPGAAAPPGAPTGPAITPRAGMPTLPPMPVNLAAGGMPAMPMMPPMGAMMPHAIPELKKTDKTRIIHGFACTLYQIGDRMEQFEIWATPDSALFPFRLLRRNFSNRHFGPLQLEEQWVEALQKKSLFPLEATLRMDGSATERFFFKVTKVEKLPAKAERPADLFAVPKNYFEVEPPRF